MNFLMPLVVFRVVGMKMGTERVNNIQLELGIVRINVKNLRLNSKVRISLQFGKSL